MSSPLYKFFSRHSQLCAFDGLRYGDAKGRFAREKFIANFDVLVVLKVSADDTKCGNATGHMVPIVRQILGNAFP